MPAAAYKIRIRLENKLMQKKFEKIISQLPDFITQDDEDFERTDLMIIELGEDPNLTFGLMQTLLNNYEVGEIFLSSDSIDHNILTKARWAGAREFFGPSTEETEIRSALERFALRQAKARAEDAPVKEGQVISVMGSKGGVGATTIAVNLAVSLAAKKHNKAVALLDMKLFGDVHLFMEIEPSYTWIEITKNIPLMDAAFLKSILTSAPSGVHVLPSPAYLPTHNMATPEKIERLFKVMSQMFDFIVVDMGHVLNQTTLKILEVSDRVFLVAVQNFPCMARVHMMQRTFRDLGYPASENIHIILNGYVKKANIDIEDMKKSLGQEVFWTIPKDYPTTISAINEGQPLAEIAPNKGITKSFKELAHSLINAPEEGN
jgi:pilus assembly protein CpaE